MFVHFFQMKNELKYEYYITHIFHVNNNKISVQFCQFFQDEI